MAAPRKTPSVDDLMSGLSRDSQEALRVRSRPVVVPPRPLPPGSVALPRPRWISRVAAIALAVLVLALAFQGWSAWNAGREMLDEVRTRARVLANPPPEPLPAVEDLRDGERFARLVDRRPGDAARLHLARIEALAQAERWTELLDAGEAYRRDCGALPAPAELRRAEAQYAIGDARTALDTAMQIDGQGLAPDRSAFRTALIGRCHQRLSALR